jgi:hypothetical protein
MIRGPAGVVAALCGVPARSDRFVTANREEDTLWRPR